MKSIDDFELLLGHEESRFRRGDGPVPADIPDRPPARKGLRSFVAGYLDLAMWFHSLLYRGADIPHLHLMGSHVAAQFETAKGFIVCTCHVGDESDRHSTGFYIHYVLKDFSGMDWVETSFRWYYPQDRGAFIDTPLPPAMNPVLETWIVDDRHLDIRFRRLGWCRVTLYEDAPRLCRMSVYPFNGAKVPIWVPRHLRVAKLWWPRKRR